jgi:hypothetical protein
MSQRQRRRRDQRRKQAQRRGPSKRQVVTGATIAMGATLAATGSAQAADFTVSNLNDSGPGSLRQAVLDSNNNGNGLDNIVFASGLSGTIDIGTFDGDGLYPGTPMNIKGPGADKITLRGVNNVDYVVFTGTYGTTGYAGEPITLSGLTITGGDADNSLFTDRGGGIYNRNANLTVSNSVITGNHASDDGAGIYTNTNSLALVNSTVSGNTAGSGSDSYGGGIYSQDSPVVIRNSTISGNTVGGDGGGIYMSAVGFEPSLTIENSTIANNSSTANSSDDEGGGIWVCCGDDGQQLKITSSTITGNRVGGSFGAGGGVYTATNTSDQVTINNTIVANNTGTKGNDVYLQEGGQIGFSLIKDTANSTDTGYSLISTGPNITGVDPQLGPLANNGGPTQTEALGTKSPAIDKGAGFGLTSDQRGVLRPIDFPAIANAAGGNGADIGAFELQPNNKIKLGKLKQNKQSGTGKQVVKVPQPAAGTLTIKGKGLKTKSLKIGKKTKKKVKLPVIPKGSAKGEENATGSVSLKEKVIYKPIGNAKKTLKRKLKLLKS